MYFYHNIQEKNNIKTALVVRIKDALRSFINRISLQVIFSGICMVEISSWIYNLFKYNILFDKCIYWKVHYMKNYSNFPENYCFYLKYTITKNWHKNAYHSTFFWVHKIQFQHYTQSLVQHRAQMLQ